MAKWRKGKSDRKIREKKKSDNPFVKKKGWLCECALHIVVFFFLLTTTTLLVNIATVVNLK